jgi:hypothetical protein
LHERVHPWRRAYLHEQGCILGKGAHTYDKGRILGRGCTCLRRLQGLERGAPKAKGLFCWSLNKRGCTCPKASPNITKFLQGGASTSGAKASQGKGKAEGKEAKGLAREEGRTKAKGAFVQGLAGTSIRHSKASKFGCYCTRFTCICFPYCTHALRSPNIYIYL